MTILRRAVATALIAGLHFSLCTGGLLSSASALAAGLAQPALNSDQLMSVAPPDALLCAFFSEAQTEERGDKVTRKEDTKGCAQGNACLTSSVMSGRERIGSPLLPVANATLSLGALTYSPVYEITPAINLARAGPHHSSARLLATTLIKRE